MKATSDESSVVGPSLMESMWRHRLLIPVATIVAGLMGFAISQATPVRYDAYAQLYLVDPQSGQVFGETSRIDPYRHVAKQADLVVSTPVLARASQSLGGTLSPAELEGRVSTSTDPELDLIVVQARDSQPDRAAFIADAVAIAYQETVAEEVNAGVDEAIARLAEQREDLEQRVSQIQADIDAAGGEDLALQTQLDATVQQLVALQDQAANLAINGSLRGSGVELFERAAVPGTPSQPRPRATTALAAVLGLIGAVAFAWWRAGHAQTAESSSDPGEVLGAPLLGEVPVFKGQATSHLLNTAESREIGEPYQFIVSSLEFALAETGGSSVLITSAAPGDGKSLTTLNLAVAAHRDGRQVLLVDADLRARGLTAASGDPYNWGLSDYAEGRGRLEDCASGLGHHTGANLTFLPSGSPVEDPAGFFRASEFRRALAGLKERWDLLFVDSPPLLAVSDTSAIAGQVDGIVLVVNRGTRLSALVAVRERLAFIGTPLLGYVFNRAGRRPGVPYGYDYGRSNIAARRPKTAGSLKRRERQATARSG